MPGGVDDDHTSPTTVGNQKGKFVGVFNGVHVHIVKNNSHLQVGNKRYDLRDKKSYVKALEELDRRGRGKKGAASCEAWLKAEIADM